MRPGGPVGGPLHGETVDRPAGGGVGGVGGGRVPTTG